MLTYKGLNNLGPHYLMEHLSLRSTSCATHTSQALMLGLATPRENMKSTARSWALSVVATSLWNAGSAPGFLSANIQKTHNKFAFKGGILGYPPLVT